MGTLKGSVTRGAAWMVLYRLVDRSLGLVSTLFLARLLVPADFGLVAMATSLIAILELLNAFGLDVALIQRANAERVHFDTVWTLNVLAGLTIAALLVLLSWPMSLFYHEPRLVALMCVLALGSAASGCENIGVVAFRKELNFDREFRYLFTKRMLTFGMSIALALTLRNYWALAISMTAGRIMGVAISYRMHPFRPRFSFAALRDFMHFSTWVFLQNICFLLKERSADFIVGRISGPYSVGVLNVSTEIASMPGTELVAPINRAALPVYAQLAKDLPRLAAQYLSVTALVALLVTPCVAGIGALGSVVTGLLLGPKWHDASTLISLVAFVGIANVLLNTSHPAVLAVGKPAVFARITAVQVCLQIPALIVLTRASGATGAALGYVVSSVGMLPFSLYFILRTIGVRYRDYLGCIWRPLTAATVMYLVLRLVMPPIDVMHLSTLEAVVLLGKYAPLGAALYAATLAALWLLSGRPEGAELKVLRELAGRWQRLRQRRLLAGRAPR
jgi:lipopolysaccharide exporter